MSPSAGWSWTAATTHVRSSTPCDGRRGVARARPCSRLFSLAVRGLDPMTTRIRRMRPRARAGFTLTELMIVVVLVGLVGSMLTTLLMRQQSFHRAVASVADARARMRDVATILPTDMRSISTVGGDVLAMSDTSLQFRAFVGASVLCKYVTGSPTIIELPPRTLADSSVLTAWINPPGAGDMAFLYNDGALSGNQDDSWTPIAITDTTSAANAAWCASTNAIAYTKAADNAARRYRLTLASAPDQAQIKMGAPIRFAREVRYSGYQAADGSW